MVVEEGLRDSFFDPPRAEKALRLARNMRAYNAKVSCLLSILASGTTHQPDYRQLVLHAIEEIEGTRQAIVAGARLLAELK
jgi:hypothetical protein